jgi:hypothetical protein
MNENGKFQNSPKIPTKKNLMKVLISYKVSNTCIFQISTLGINYSSESRVLLFACRHVATCIPSAFSASDRTFQTMLSTVTAF